MQEILKMFKNELLKEAYEFLKERHSESESNFILTNTLAILGDKEVQVSESLDDKQIARANRYKYPERLASFVKTTSEKI
jgi:hypothetical protein